MKLLLFLLLPLFLFANVHYSKIEPYESIILKSSVSALVIDVNLDFEGSMVEDERIIYLDDTLDKINLDASLKSIELLQKMLNINHRISKSFKGTVERQEGYYKRISKLNTASKTQKDNAYSSFIAAKTQYLNTDEKIVNLEKQILEIKYKVAQLKDSILKKSIILKDKYLSKLIVKKGDFVNFGSPLAQIEDLSRAKLVLFLDSEELKNIKEKSIYLDGKKTNYKIAKIWKVADEKFISSYRAEIYISAPKKYFSKLMKVEIK